MVSQVYGLMAIMLVMTMLTSPLQASSNTTYDPRPPWSADDEKPIKAALGNPFKTMSGWQKGLTAVSITLVAGMFLVLGYTCVTTENDRQRWKREHALAREPIMPDEEEGLSMETVSRESSHDDHELAPLMPQPAGELRHARTVPARLNEYDGSHKRTGSQG